jgi:hypothetical protein
LVEEECGFIVKEGDAEQLLDCIEKIKSAPLSFDVQKQQHKFDKNVCYKKYLEIYKSISENDK